jgi:hypothetical protein
MKMMIKRTKIIYLLHYPDAVPVAKNILAIVVLLPLST